MRERELFEEFAAESKFVLGTGCSCETIFFYSVMLLVVRIVFQRNEWQ